MKKLIKKILKKFDIEIRFVKKGKTKVDFGLDVYFRNYPQKSIESKSFYNLGAGGFSHPYWTNIDKYSDWYQKVQDTEKMIDYDFFSLAPLPLKDNSAEIFYSSHAIEHVPDKVVKYLLKEVYRILKPGGIFRVLTPNIDLHYDALLRKDIDYFSFRTGPFVNKNRTHDQTRAMSMEQAFIWHVAGNVSIHHIDGSKKKLTDDDLKKLIKTKSKSEVLEKIISMADIDKQKMYPGNHINYYTFDKLKKMLKSSGFNKVYQSQYGQSKSPVMRDLFYFDTTAPEFSLYAEAVK